MTVVIRGEGIAALCCARLLNNAGIGVTLASTGRATVPALMLGAATQALLRDVFAEPDLLQGAHPIRHRIVTWGPNAQPLVVSHSAVVISEQSLLDRIRPKVKVEGPYPGMPADWTVVASRPLPGESVEHGFGFRKATALPVTLQPGSDPQACQIESVEDGWLFLLPGWLLSVGGAAHSLLDQSRVIARQVRVGCGSAEFAAYPRIAWPLCGMKWLACGTPALGFDPLCGEGAGHAIREAILASAVIRAAAGGADPAGLLAHYGGRLIAGFRRHLEVCREFYAAGGPGPWWQAELALLRQGLEWCSAPAQRADAFRYRLSGFELRPVP